MVIKGVLLDIDGTLVDSNDAHAHAWVEAFKRHGFEVPYEKVRRLIGMGGNKLVPAACDLPADSPQGKRISDSWGEIFKEDYLPNIRAFRDSSALLAAMKARGLRLVAASSAKDDMLDRLLQIAGADGLIEAKTSSDDAEHSKPAPDIVEAALQKIGYGPDEVLMLGDTPYDLEAARKAGVGLVAVRCGGWDDEGLAGAVAVYDDPADLLAHLDSSPFVS